MANQFSTWLKKKIIGRDQNLISLEDPYEGLRRLLKGHSVTGILDAGASRGHISERMLKKFPDAHVYAFEPHPMYQDTLLAYEKQQPRFHSQFMALSDCQGTAQLHVTASAGNTSLLNPTEALRQIDPVGSEIRRTVSVPMIPFDQWIEENGKIQIQLMKLDIQGYELNLLRGAAKTLAESTLAIYSEVWFNSVYEGGALLAQIDGFLRERGFILYDLYKPRYNPSGLIQWANAVFVHAGRLRI